MSLNFREAAPKWGTVLLSQASIKKWITGFFREREKSELLLTDHGKHLPSIVNQKNLYNNITCTNFTATNLGLIGEIPLVIQ